MEVLLLRQSVVLNTFKVHADPVTNLSVRNMHELDTDAATVGRGVSFEKFFEFPDAFLFANSTFLNRVQVKFTIEVCHREAVGFIVKKSQNIFLGEAIFIRDIFVITIVLFELKGVDISNQMTVSLICTDQLSNLDRFPSRTLGRGRIHLAHSRNRAAFEQANDLIKLRLLLILAKGGGRYKVSIFRREVGLPRSVNR